MDAAGHRPWVGSSIVPNCAASKTGQPLRAKRGDSASISSASRGTGLTLLVEERRRIRPTRCRGGSPTGAVASLPYVSWIPGIPSSAAWVRIFAGMGSFLRIAYGTVAKPAGNEATDADKGPMNCWTLAWGDSQDCISGHRANTLAETGYTGMIKTGSVETDCLPLMGSTLEHPE